MSLKIKYVKPKEIKGFYGMNYEASKELGVKCPKNTILIDSSLKGRMKARTIQHEKIESYLMKKKHLNYKKAHNVAMSFEKKHKVKK